MSESQLRVGVQGVGVGSLGIPLQGSTKIEAPDIAEGFLAGSWKLEAGRYLIRCTSMRVFESRSPK